MNYHDLSHLTYSLSPFFSITFPVLNSIWFAFRNSFAENAPKISSQLTSSIIYVNDTVFFVTFLITKTSSDQFHYVSHTFLYHYHSTMISLNYCEIHCLYVPYFVWFAPRRAIKKEFLY